MAEVEGFLHAETFTPKAVGALAEIWQVATGGASYTLRRFPTEGELVQRRWGLSVKFPFVIAAEVPGDVVEKLGLRPGDFVRANTSFGLSIKEVNGKPVSTWQKFIAGRKPDEGWLSAGNERRRLLQFSSEAPNLLAISALLVLSMGSSILFTGSAAAGKTLLSNEIFRGLIPEPNMVRMLLQLGERTHEVSPEKAGWEVWALPGSVDQIEAQHFVDLFYSVAQARALSGRHVVVLLDSMYRVAEAFNIKFETTGGMTGGGAKPEALLELFTRYMAVAKFPPGEESGSLSIISSVLYEEANRFSQVLAQVLVGRADVSVRLMSPKEFKITRNEREMQRKGDWLPVVILWDMAVTNTRNLSKPGGPLDQSQVPQVLALQSTMIVLQDELATSKIKELVEAKSTPGRYTHRASTGTGGEVEEIQGIAAAELRRRWREFALKTAEKGLEWAWGEEAFRLLNDGS